MCPTRGKGFVVERGSNKPCCDDGLDLSVPYGQALGEVLEPDDFHAEQGRDLGREFPKALRVVTALPEVPSRALRRRSSEQLVRLGLR